MAHALPKVCGEILSQAMKAKYYQELLKRGKTCYCGEKAVRYSCGEKAVRRVPSKRPRHLRHLPHPRLVWL